MPEGNTRPDTTCQYVDALPRGFYDFTGSAAQARRDVTNTFFGIAERHGFDSLQVSPVAYADPYLHFGTAAHDRHFPFQDRKGRNLILCPDAVPSCIRAYLQHGAGKTGRPAYLATAASIFRYRHKRYRHWTQLVGTIINEPSPLAADIALISFAYEFATLYWPDVLFVVADYGIVDETCDHVGIGREEGRAALHQAGRFRRGHPHEADLLCSALERIAMAAEGHPSGGADQFRSVVSEAPWLTARIRYAEYLLGLIASLGIASQLTWNFTSALDYHSSISWLLRRASDGEAVADGGSYDSAIKGLTPRVGHCASLAFSLDAIADDVHATAERLRSVFVLQLDSSDRFLLRTCAALRRNGYATRLLWSVRSLVHTLSELPRNALICVVGRKEENASAVLVRDGAAGLESDISINVDPTEVGENTR